MDEGIPYADDVPYEEQLPDTQEEMAATSLKERIGNRIYLLEDSRKRKSVDTEKTAQDEEPDDDATDADADLSHRPNALLLCGPPVSQLPTARVFAYATHFDAHPIGLEWVDDETCVLVFASRKNALQAWNALRRPSHAVNTTTAMQLDDADEDTLFPAPPLPLALYPIEERINSVLGTQKSMTLKKAINIRWARPSDIKQPGARERSAFYKKHGETAGKEGAPGVPQHKRRKPNTSDADVRRELDADLDTILEGAEDGLSANLHVGEKRKRSQHEETRQLLDNELDSFLAHGGELDAQAPATRTMRPLPGRSHRSNYQTDGNGRWLYNSEIRRRRPKKTYDEDGFGMRAWRRDDEGEQPTTSGGRARSRRPRKTQEELDHELEEFLANEDIDIC